MQALEWAVLYPDQVDAIVAIASTHALQPQGVAWNAIARNAIMADPGLAGRPLLRHRTQAGRRHGRRADGRPHHVPVGEIAGRQVRPAAAVRAIDIRYTLTDPEFEVESYLRHQADTFVKRFDANTYLYTSRALTYFDLARQYGDGSLTDALRHVRARTLLIAFSSDWLYPPAGSPRAGGRASRAREGRRAPRDRRALRPRLFSPGGSAPDADDSELSGGQAV